MGEDQDTGLAAVPPDSSTYTLTDEEREAIEEGLVFLEERDFPKASQLLKRIYNRACSTYSPDWASPPGNTIAMMMKDKGLGEADLCRAVGIHPSSIDLLLSGRLTINEPMAKHLSSFLGVSVEFWLTREFNYRATLARLAVEKK